MSGEQLEDLTTGGQVQAVEDKVTQMEIAHRQYVDQAMAAARTKLQAEINGKFVMIKAEVQLQLNELKSSIGEALKMMKGQVAGVQKSQDKIWGAISRMGEELRERRPGRTAQTRSGKLVPKSLRRKPPLHRFRV